MNYEELAVVYAWEPIASKNKYMLSFKKGTRRMNIYFTTGTITIQDSEDYGKCEKYGYVIDEATFEDILIKCR